MATDDSLLELEKSLLSRLELTKHERVHIKEGIEHLNAKIKVLFGSTKNRPRETDEEIVDTIKMVEYTHATTPQTNLDERLFMRELEKLKKKRKEFADYIAAQTSIDELKSKRSALQRELKEKEVCLDELHQGARKVRVALKLNCQPNVLTEESIVIPEEKLAQVIGRGGSGVKGIESECHVGIDSDKIGGVNRLRVVGMPSGVALAIAKIQLVLATVSEELTLTDTVLVCLLKDRAAIVLQIQDRCNVHIDVSRANKTCRITGLSDQVTRALSEISKLDCCSRKVSIDASVLPFIFGKGGVVIRALQDDHSVHIDVNKEKLVLDISGTRANVEAATTAISELVTEHKEVEERIECSRHVMMEAVIGPKGALIRQLQKDLNIGLTLVREGDEGGTASGSGMEILVIKGNAAKTALAKHHILDIIEKFELGIETITPPADCIPIILGKKGSRISSLREEHPNVAIDVVTATNSIRLHSENAVDRAAAKSAIQAIIDDNMTADFSIAKDAAISLKGAKGAETRAYLLETLNLNFDINVDEETIKFRGRGSNFPSGIEVINRFCEDNYTLENLYSDEDLQCLMSGGKDNSVTKKISAEFSVEIYVKRDKSSVRIVGNRQAVNAAESALNSILQGDSAESTLVPMSAAALGALIGKGGTKIKEFESKHSVKVDILRSRNQVRVRGSDDAVQSAVLTLMAFLDKQRVTNTLDISSSAASESMSNAKLQDICAKAHSLYGIETSIQQDDCVVLNGSLKQVEEGKKFILESLSGEGETFVPVLSHHAQYFIDSEDAMAKLEHSAASAGVTASISSADCSRISLKGSCASMTKARLNVYRLLDFLFPVEFSSVPTDTLTLQCLWNDSVRAHTLTRLFPYAVVYYDFVMSCVRIVVADSSTLNAVVDHVREIIVDLKKRICTLELTAESLEAIKARKGTVLQPIEKATGVSIQLPRRDQSFITILGPDENSVEVARAKLLETANILLKENWSIRLPSDIIGSLIGKQGANVKSLRTETKANIDIDARTCVVKVNGKEECVADARKRILEFAAEREAENNVLKLFVTPQCFGMIIGPKGATIRDLKIASGVMAIDIDRPNSQVVIRGRYIYL